MIYKFETFCDLRGKKEISLLERKKPQVPELRGDTCLPLLTRGEPRTDPPAALLLSGNQMRTQISQLISFLSLLGSKPEYIFKIRYSTQPKVYILENKMKEITSKEFGRW